MNLRLMSSFMRSLYESYNYQMLLIVSYLNIFIICGANKYKPLIDVRKGFHWSMLAEKVFTFKQSFNLLVLQQLSEMEDGIKTCIMFSFPCF